MDLNSSDLSGIPADLLAAHESQKGTEVFPQPVNIKIETVEKVQSDSAIKENEKDTLEKVKNESDKMADDNKEGEQMDAIDEVIADKAIKEEGYESSDIELSSDEESDSSSSSDEDEEDEEEDEEGEKGKKENNKDKMMADYDEDEDAAPDGVIKTAHEIVDIVVEKPHFEFTPQTEIIYAGNIYQIIDNVVVVHCRPGSEHSTLDQDSLLVYQDRDILGEVFETFGPVARPYYSVRFNNASEIDTNLCKVGDPVFYVPSYNKTRIVQTEELKKIKGYDASNMYDEEIAEEDMEFSDDEKELEFKRRKNKEKKKRTRQRNGEDNQSNFAPQKRVRALPNDFDSALADYESIQAPLPPRQQQSYADLNESYTFQPAANQQMMPSFGRTYQTPADLVSGLFKSTGNQYNRPQSSLQQPHQQHIHHQPVQQQVQQQVPQQQVQQQAPQQPQQPQQEQLQKQNQDAKKAIRAIFAEPPPPSTSS